MDTLALTLEYFLSLISALFLSRLAWYHEHPLGDQYWVEGLGGRGGSSADGSSRRGEGKQEVEREGRGKEKGKGARKEKEGGGKEE